MSSSQTLRDSLAGIQEKLTAIESQLETDKSFFTSHFDEDPYITIIFITSV